MFDAVTYGAAVGAAKRYTDEHSGSDDAVKYTEQSLTSEQQAQARTNIGAAASDDIPTDAVKYTAQTLTDAQKTQARTNIGVVQSDWNAYNSVNPDFIKNKPLVKVGQGTGGNLISGTGLENNTNEAKKLNSIAHGRNVTANGNYSIAAGQYVQANNDYEIAYGRCNQSNADTAFSIGDGTDTQNRHNLMELKTDGTLLLNGNAVKTEGGDDDDDYYPMLGQVYEWGGSSYYRYGFKAALSSSYSVIDIIFYSDDHDTRTSYDTVIGDFRVRASTSASQTTIYLMVPDGAVVDTSRPWIHIQNGYYLFDQCRITANTTNAISKFDTSRVKNMTNMFSRITSSVSTLDLSSFDTCKVKSMNRMFYGSTAITTLDLSSFDMSNVVEYTDMFGSSGYEAGITTLKCPKINPHDDIPLNKTLYSQDGTAYTNLPVTTGTSIELRQSWT